MKQLYEAPSVTLKELDIADVLTVSGVGDGYNEGKDTMPEE